MQFDLECFEMYVNLNDYKKYIPYPERPIEYEIDDSLADRLTQIGLAENGIIECKVYSIFRMKNVLKIYDRDIDLINDTRAKTGYPKDNLTKTYTPIVLRLYTEELNCFFDYDIREHLGRENDPSPIKNVHKKWLAELEWCHIGELHYLQRMVKTYDKSSPELLRLPSREYIIPIKLQYGSYRRVDEKRTEVFGNKLIGEQKDKFKQPYDE